ncbi:MAG: hypothetical protein GY786_00130, partial [Proteobacteria bacterium]|nr:hypothetical protein [Pseudomonadota bacterium]
MSSFFRSLHIKIIFCALLPSLCVIVGIALLISFTIKNTALDVVKKRDVVLAKFAANRLSENLQKYPHFLNTLAEHKEKKKKKT